jgi:hypothetical protein
MGYAFTFMGASSDTYTAILINPKNPKALPHTGGVLFFSSYTPTPLGIFAAPNISVAFPSLWAKAAEDFGAEIFHVIVGLDPDAAQAAQADLVAAYDPPMNRTGVS